MIERTAPYKVLKSIVALEGKENRLFKKILDVDGIKKLIISLNTVNQLGFESVDSEGNPLTNRFTGSTTYSPNDPLGRGGQDYRIFETGDYWDTFKVIIMEGYIVIESNPFKENDNLFDMFGEQIEGLTDDSIKTLIPIVLKLYLKHFRLGIKQRNLDII